MQLGFLGRGSAFYTQEGNTAAFIREGEKLLLLDCGETVFERLTKAGILKGIREVYVAISHLHADHCGSLGTISLYCKHILQKPMTILLPDDELYCAEIRNLMRIFGTREDGIFYMRDEQFSGLKTVRSLRYVPTKHAPGMRCFSFVLEDSKGAVFYSADTITMETVSEFLDKYDSVEAIYMDACLKAGGVHLDVESIYEALPEEQRVRTRLMHVDSEACIARGRELGLETVSVYKGEQWS